MKKGIIIGLTVLVVLIVCAAAVYAVQDHDDDHDGDRVHDGADHADGGHSGDHDSTTLPADDGGGSPVDDGSGSGSSGDDTTAKGLVLTVDGREVPVEWDDNASVDALKALAADTLTIRMHAYGGFEQTGSMDRRIVSDDSWMSVSSGDIVLYRSIQVCLYHGDNAYSFTHLGRITGMTEQEIDSLLDKGSVTAVFTLA